MIMLSEPVLHSTRSFPQQRDKTELDASTSTTAIAYSIMYDHLLVHTLSGAVTCNPFSRVESPSVIIHPQQIGRSGEIHKTITI